MLCLQCKRDHWENQHWHLMCSCWREMYSCRADTDREPDVGERDWWKRCLEPRGKLQQALSWLNWSSSITIKLQSGQNTDEDRGQPPPPPSPQHFYLHSLLPLSLFSSLSTSPLCLLTFLPPLHIFCTLSFIPLCPILHGFLFSFHFSFLFFQPSSSHFTILFSSSFSIPCLPPYHISFMFLSSIYYFFLLVSVPCLPSYLLSLLSLCLSAVLQLLIKWRHGGWLMMSSASAVCWCQGMYETVY